LHFENSCQHCDGNVYAKESTPTGDSPNDEVEVIAQYLFRHHEEETNRQKRKSTIEGVPRVYAVLKRVQTMTVLLAHVHVVLLPPCWSAGLRAVCSQHGSREIDEFIAFQDSHFFTSPHTRIEVFNVVLEVIDFF
jgi:hypothetical protein